MNQREVGELRRRFRPDRSAISRIYGCYVNGRKEIISQVDASLGNMPQEECEQYLNLMKKVLTGSLGRNLIDIEFSTRQVADSEEHRLLMSLRDTRLEDAETRQALYRRIIDALDMEGGNYLILLAYDAYDVPWRGGDDQLQADAADTVFSYIVCCVCPVKDGKLALGFFSGENAFHCRTASQLVAPPELGFLFPAFDDRAANLYNALFYSKRPDQIHQEVIDAVFRTEPPMSAAEQREAFEEALSGALEDACSMEVAQAVHERLREQIMQHKESRDPEPLALTAEDVGDILRDCEVEEERVAAFVEECSRQFGDNAVLTPGNLINRAKFEVETANAKISLDPASSYLIETRVIDGRKYLLIPADEVTVNGLAVHIQQKLQTMQ